MPDARLQILIDFIARTQGAAAAQQALAELKEGTGDTSSATTELGAAVEQTGEKVKVFSGHGKEMRKLVGELTRDFPIAGLALRAFLSPIGAVLTVGVTAFRLLKEQINETNKALDDLAAKASASLGNRIENQATAAHNAAIAHNDFALALKSAAEGEGSLLTAFAKENDDINRQITNLKKLNDARKEAEIAQATTPEQKQAIEQRYKTHSQDLDALGAQAKLQELRRVHKQAIEDYPALIAREEELNAVEQKVSAALRTHTDEAAKASDQLKKDSDIQKAAAAAADELERLRRAPLSLGGGPDSGIPAETQADRDRALADAEKTAAAAEAAVKTQEKLKATAARQALADQKRLDANTADLEDTKAKATEAQKIKDEFPGKITGAKQDFNTDVQARVIAAGGADKVFGQATAAMDALNHGKKIDAGQQQSINLLSEMMATINWQQGQVLDLMRHHLAELNLLKQQFAALKQQGGFH